MTNVDRREFLGIAAGVGVAAARAPGAGRRAQGLKILILGGTGLTGPHQVRYALARGHTVTVFNRGRRNERLPKGVEELKGDRALRQLDALKGRDWDVVIDNPTTLPFWVKDAASLLKGHVGQYVFISTISVYDPAGQSSIVETSPLVEYRDGDPLTVTQEQFSKNFETLYGRMKTASEREASKWFGDQTTIIRPGLIVGPGDGTFRFGYWPYRIDKGGEILAPGDGSDPVQIIDTRDLAEWTIRMVENRAMGTFNACGPRSPMTMAEQLAGIRGALSGDKALRFTWVPADFLAAQQVTPWGEMPTWIPATDPEHVISKTSNAKAVAAGLTFRPLGTSAVDALVWFQGLPETTRAQVVKNAGLTEEKERTVLAAWHQRKRS
ncbi:MAG: NAD-dependent epimerase/dehydratase family protein [Gemmatimonadales bacterium]